MDRVGWGRGGIAHTVLVFGLLVSVSRGFAWPAGSIAATDTKTKFAAHVGRSRHLPSPDGKWIAWIEGASLVPGTNEREMAEPAETTSPGESPSSSVASTEDTTPPFDERVRLDHAAERVWNLAWIYHPQDGAPGEEPPRRGCYLSHVFVKRRVSNSAHIVASVGSTDPTTRTVDDLKLVAWSPDSKRLLVHWNFRSVPSDGHYRTLIEIDAAPPTKAHAPISARGIAVTGSVENIHLVIDQKIDALLQAQGLDYGDREAIPSTTLGYVSRYGVLIEFLRPHETDDSFTPERWVVDWRKATLRKVAMRARPVSSMRER